MPDQQNELCCAKQKARRRPVVACRTTAAAHRPNRHEREVGRLQHQLQERLGSPEKDMADVSALNTSLAEEVDDLSADREVLLGAIDFLQVRYTRPCLGSALQR
jgi:hypothetical protein